MMAVNLGIWREVLLRLPAECLLQFSAVCKGWRTIINDPGFVKAHTNNHLSSPNASNVILRNSTGPPFSPLYYFNLGDLNCETEEPQTIPVVPLSLTRGGLSSLRSLPVASCNGLLLTPPEVDRWDWEIRNPLTQERLKLPQPNIDANSKVVGYGLGYDSAADDFKVVVIAYFLSNSKIQTHVYSLKSDSWKKIGNCPFDLLNTNQRRGVFLNGALHWVSSDDDDGITVLDVGTESYRQLSLPDFERGPTSTTQLDALSGCLFLTHRYKKDVVHDYHTNKDCKHTDAWVMSNDGGKENSWLKFFSSRGDKEGDLRPVAYLKNKMRVFLQDDVQIFSLDFECSKRLKRVNIHAVCSKNGNSIFSAQAFVGSLFRLPGRRVAATKQKKNTGFSKLTFCVSAKGCPDCYRLNSNWYHPSCHGGKEKICESPFTPNDTLSFVPLDICREIFFRLPAKSLLRFRAVCSAWRAILVDPGFVKAYTNKQPSSSSDTNIIIRSSTGPPFYPLCSLDLDDLDFTDGLQRIAVTPFDFTPREFPCRQFPFRLVRFKQEEVASCNGLMLIPYKNTYEIWNPLTRESLKLPQPNIKRKWKVGTGLWYDCASDDFKAVVIHRLFHNRVDYTTQIHVYSLRTDSWRNLGDFPCDPKGVGVFFCGALHWIESTTIRQVESTIVSLDLGTESNWEMQLPPPFFKKSHFGKFPYRKSPYLSVLGDCLAFSAHSDEHFVVWVMEDYGDEDYSWKELFSIERTYYKIGTTLRPVVYVKDKTQVFLQDNEFGFYVFDLERNSMKKVCIHGQLRNFCAQFIHGTLFRLRDNCGASGKRRRTTINRRKKKMKLSDTELYFCVRDAKSWEVSHDVCHSLDPDWEYLSSEDEEEDEY